MKYKENPYELLCALPSSKGEAVCAIPRRSRFTSRVALGVFALSLAASHAAPLLTPGDPVFAYDLDTAGVNYPGGESPAHAIDGNSGTKYLNQYKYCAGIIVTATTAATAQSLVLTTANDSAERDPSSYIILGTNEPITSADKSNGFADHWQYIGQGTLSLPSGRLTAGAAINLSNTKSYKSYWIVFPTTKDTIANSLMQIGEIQLYTGTGGTGSAIFAPGNPALCTGWNSSIASGEIVSRVIDGNSSTKYLNFGENNSGFFVVPSVGPSIIDSFQLTTANDSDVRDPATWQIDGLSPSTGLWSTIGSGSVSLPTARGAVGPVVSVANTNPYSAYRMTFTTVRNAASANSMQVAEAQFFGTILPSKDVDFDGMDDDWEVLYGLVVGTNDSTGDPDTDGSDNLEEYQRATLPNDSDTDNDGLSDGVETDTGTFVSASNTGTDPLNGDSDADSYGDSYEVTQGTDPNSVGSVPTITWDINPGTAGAGDSAITGGTGIWDNLGAANWSSDEGANNVTWNNGGQRLAAIFGGDAGTVTISGAVTADRVMVNTAGYVFNGDTLTLGSSNPIINVASGVCEMSQVLAGSNGFTKQGNGQLTLTGLSNVYTGTTALKGVGKIVLAKDPGHIAIPGNLFLDSFAFVGNTSGLVLGGDEQIADTSIVSWADVGQADTYFRLNGHVETIGGLVSIGVGGFVNIENRGFGDTTSYDDGLLIINTTGSNTYSYNGNIRNIDGGTLGGTVQITKTGTGTQIFSGNTSYSGATTVEGGTLQINGNLFSSAVTVKTSGTIAGTGNLGAGLTVETGGSVAPGTTGVGTLTTGAANISGTYVCQIDGASADRLTVNGGLNITGATLQISIVNAPTANTLVIASHTGLTGTFSVSGVPSGYVLQYDNVSNQIVLVKPSFALWAAANGLTGGTSADFDNDGLADAVEYVLGSDPKIATANAPVGMTSGGNFIFSFTRADAAMTADISLAIEVDDDLETWADVYQVGANTAASTAGVTVTDNGATDTITLTIPRGSITKTFARLRVTVGTP